MNLGMTYGLWIRTGMVEFGFESPYWTVEQIGVGGWRREGARFGVHSMASKIIESDQPSIDFVYDGSQEHPVTAQDVNIVHHYEIRSSYGWPFTSMTKLNLFQKTMFIEAGLTAYEVNTDPVTPIELTPDPQWYFSGVPTGLSDSPFQRIPVAISPRGFILNSILYAFFLAVLVWLWRTVFRSKPKNKIRCFGCGKLILDVPECPVCGLVQLNQAAAWPSD